jgi:hypothetical protein
MTTDTTDLVRRAHTINFDQSSWNFIHERASELGLSISAAVRIIIRQEIARQQQQNKELTV